MLAKDGRVIITDFGIARAMRDGSTHARHARRNAATWHRSKSRVLMISTRGPHIYALGVMMYEMIVDAPAFDGDSVLR